MNYLELFLMGGWDAILISALILAGGVFMLRQSPKLARIGLGYPLLCLGGLASMVSLYHTLVFISLNDRLPPIGGFDRPKPSAADIPVKPVATFTMENGRVFKLELNPFAAPDTVNCFISLIQKGYYDGTIFRRMEKDKLIQVADPSLPALLDLLISPGYSLYGEFAGNGYDNPMNFSRGDIGMAMHFGRTASAGGFFIMTTDMPQFTAMMPAFGTVIEGMDVVDQINATKTENMAGFSIAPNPPVIQSVTVDLFGVTYPEPVRLPNSQYMLQAMYISNFLGLDFDQ